MSELSLFLENNNPESRRNLKSLIEERMIKINRNFLVSFRDMKESFQKVCGGNNLFLIKNFCLMSNFFVNINVLLQGLTK